MGVGRRWVLALIAAGAVIGGGGALASSAVAAPLASVNLGAGSFGTFAVDPVTGDVFLSLPQTNEVAKLSPQGKLLATISHVYGAFGMTIVGRDLYVAESTNGTIGRIDLTQTTPSAQQATAGLDAPLWIAYAGGKLWVGTEPAEGASQLVAVNPATGASSAFGGSYYGSFVAASSADPNALYMAEDQEEPEPLHRFDVSSGVPRDTVSNPSRDWEGAWHNMVLSPDGSRLIGAVGAPYEFDELCSQTLQPDGLRYPGQAYPQAVGMSQSGVLATALTADDNPNLAVFKLGVPSAYFTVESAYQVESGGLALSPDGRTLYVAESDGSSPSNTIVETYALPAQPAEQGTNPCPAAPGGSSGSGSGSGAGTNSSTSSAGTPSSGPATLRVSVVRRGGEVRAIYQVTPRKGVRRPAAGFTLTLVLRARRSASRGRLIGYRYRMTLSHLRCSGGATELVLALGRRKLAVSCGRFGLNVAGTLAPAKAYTIRTAAIRVHAHRTRLGLAYVFFLAPKA